MIFTLIWNRLRGRCWDGLLRSWSHFYFFFLELPYFLYLSFDTHRTQSRALPVWRRSLHSSFQKKILQYFIKQIFSNVALTAGSGWIGGSWNCPYRCFQLGHPASTSSREAASPRWKLTRASECVRFMLPQGQVTKVKWTANWALWFIEYVVWGKWSFPAEMVISQRPLSYLSLKAMMTKRKTISLTLILMIFDRLMIVDYSLL